MHRASSRPSRVRGLKLPPRQSVVFAITVAPLAGAWIETPRCAARRARPRGLKRRAWRSGYPGHVAPLAARRLKRRRADGLMYTSGVAPSGAGGLKLVRSAVRRADAQGASLKDAWIEIVKGRALARILAFVALSGAGD